MTLSKIHVRYSSEFIRLPAVLLAFFFLFAACSPSKPDNEQIEATRPSPTTVPATATTRPPATGGANSLTAFIDALGDAGAAVVNSGQSEQGLFPVDDVTLWHLIVNGANVNVFVFADAAARQAVSDNISLSGYEYTTTEGDTTVKTQWDGEGSPHFWVEDNLLVNYWGDDDAVVDALSAALGRPFAGGIVASDLDTFISELELAVTNQNYELMQSLMSDPIAVGGWRSEWRTLNPQQMISQFQTGSLPPPSGVQFSEVSDEEITRLIGQPPDTMFGPDVNVVTALHSSGWGLAANDDAVLFIVEEDGGLAWYAFLYTEGRFADANLAPVTAPAGLIYRVAGDGIYQIQIGGEHRQLLDEQTASIPNLLISPNGRHAAYSDDERRLWLINTTIDSQTQLAEDHELSGFLLWGDSQTLYAGVWLNPSEGDGPNNGHIATINVGNGELQILDETTLSSGRPALLSDYTFSAFDVFSSGPDDMMTGRLYHPDSGLQTFDQSTFTAVNDMIQGPLFNPAWSPDPNKIAWLTSTGERFAVQVFDREEKTVTQIYDWDPARFGALVPSPAWSPGGKWLAVEVWANEPGGGIWLLAADGSSQILIDPVGHEPRWLNEFQLVFNLNGVSHLYDAGSGERLRLDLPEPSMVLNYTDPADLVLESGSVAETSVMFVLALQDLTMYGGPGDGFEVIGGVFDGQTALVTGQSLDSGWWRVICPDDTFGDCWVSADPAFTQPSDGLDPQTNLPDPFTIAVASEVTVDSPNGRWQAITTQTEPILINDAEQFFASLTVTDGETSWSPVAEWRGYGLGYTWPATHQWSQDSRTLYFTDFVAVDGCSLFANGSDLYQLDTTDGNITELIPAGRPLNMALAPDESAVAYTRFEDEQVWLHILHIASGDEQKVAVTEPGQNTQAGNIIWSPEGDQILLTVAYDPCLPTSTHSILKVEVPSLATTALIDRDDRQFNIEGWTADDLANVTLVDKNSANWLLDVNSGELVEED